MSLGVACIILAMTLLAWVMVCVTTLIGANVGAAVVGCGVGDRVGK